MPVSTALRLNPRELLLALPGATDDRELAESMLTGVVVAAGGVAPTFVHGDDVGTAVAERPRAVTHEGDDGAEASDDDGETLAHAESAAAESTRRHHDARCGSSPTAATPGDCGASSRARRAPPTSEPPRRATASPLPRRRRPR
ncbi:MAG: hypothetical protein U0168_13395 [Nannocystaceae bacterium]